MTDTIRFLKTRNVKSPSRANTFDAGIDFYIPEFNSTFLKDLINKNPWQWINELKVLNLLDDEFFILSPHKRILIPSGIYCQMSNPYRALISANKSGVASKMGLIFGAQVVDYEYQGEIHINLINTGDEGARISAGMKAIQFIETPIFNSEILVEENKTTQEFYEKKTTRAETGFGASDNR